MQCCKATHLTRLDHLQQDQNQLLLYYQTNQPIDQILVHGSDCM